jgi:hypothetical protein
LAKIFQIIKLSQSVLSLFGTEKVSLEAIKDIVIYNLKTNNIVFDEEKIREILNRINDLNTLRYIGAFSILLGEE